MKSKHKETLAELLFLLPSLIGLCTFFLIPFIDTIRRSFYDARGEAFIGGNGYACGKRGAAVASVVALNK